LEYIWTSRETWRKKGGPWLGGWNYKLTMLFPILLTLSGLFPVAIVLIDVMLSYSLNPLQVIVGLIHIIQTTNDPDLVFLIFYTVSISSFSIGTIPRLLRTVWFMEDLLIVYDEATYVHDLDRGGLLLKEGDVDTLIIIPPNELIFILTRIRRGLRYLEVYLLTASIISPLASQ